MRKDRIIELLMLIMLIGGCRQDGSEWRKNGWSRPQTACDTLALMMDYSIANSTPIEQTMEYYNKYKNCAKSDSNERVRSQFLDYLVQKYTDNNASSTKQKLIHLKA